MRIWMQTGLEYINLDDCYLDDNDIICLARALHRNFKLSVLIIAYNNILPHAFSELLLAVQYSAISTVIYDGQITMAHKIMLDEINNNRCIAHMPPLHLGDMCMVYSLAVQCGKRMASLPPEFLTGQKESLPPMRI